MRAGFEGGDGWQIVNVFVILGNVAPFVAATFHEQFTGFVGNEFKTTDV